MIRVIMTRGSHFAGAPFYFPATPGEMGEYAARLDQVGNDADKLRVVVGTISVEGLIDYLKPLELNSADDLTKLNVLGIKISEMSETERWIFSGALESEPVNSLDDVLRVSGSLEQYLFLPDMTHDRELGEYLVQRGFLENCPENIRPYLDYGSIGAEFRKEHGGVYNLGGYVVRKENVPELAEEDRIEPWRNEEIEEIVHLQLQTEKTKQRGEPYCLVLPADISYLEESAGILAWMTWKMRK